MPGSELGLVLAMGRTIGALLASLPSMYHSDLCDQALETLVYRMVHEILVYQMILEILVSHQFDHIGLYEVSCQGYGQD